MSDRDIILTLPIEGMTCASCVGRVEKALRAVPGVTQADVNLMTERARVSMVPPDRTALVRAVERAGYGLRPEPPAVTHSAAAEVVPDWAEKVVAAPSDLAIEGMTCASCVGRVEKALRAVPGVTRADVNLMTERAQVQGSAAPEALIAAVARAGYGASLPAAAQAPDTPSTSGVAAPPVTPGAPSASGGVAPLATPGARREAEAAVLRRDMTIAAALTLPVVVIEMGGHMIPAFHHWLGSLLDRLLDGLLGGVLGGVPAAVPGGLAAGVPGGGTGLVSFTLTTLVLIGPGRRFYARGIPALLRGGPDMNSLVALGTLAAWGYSTTATFAPGWMPDGTTHVYFEAAASIVTLVLAGRWLEARAKGRSSQAIARLIGLQPRTARRRDPDGRVREVALAELAPADLIEIRPGERLAVDGVVVEGESFVDESAITGEPVPVRRAPGDPVTGGTVNQAGALTIRATAVGKATVLARIIRLVEDAQAGKLPIQALVDRVTLWFVPAVMGLSLLTFGMWMVWGPEPRLGHALVNAVAVLIVACPCAMGLATPVSIMVGTGRGAELGILFRRGEALQSLAEVGIVALDKTGTLTEGRPALTEFELVSGDAADEVSANTMGGASSDAFSDAAGGGPGAARSAASGVEPAEAADPTAGAGPGHAPGRAADPAPGRATRAASSHASDHGAASAAGHAQGHVPALGHAPEPAPGHARAPALGRAVPGLASASTIGPLLDPAPGATPASGDHERARLLAAVAAVEARSEHPLARAIVAAAETEGLAPPGLTRFETATGRGVSGVVGGRRITIGSARMLAEGGIALPSAMAARAGDLARQGRTALFACVDGQAAAVIGIADPVKPDTPAALQALRAQGLAVAVLTGDAEATAQAVAAPLGIAEVQAGLLPAGKVEAVRDLQARHGALAFVGDGINDAPALAQADVGIAIGTGTDIAIESADVVLMSGSLSGVPTAIRLGRAVLGNIRQNLFWAFAYNVALIPVAMGLLYPAFGITLSPILAAGAMAVSSVVVISNALRLRRFQPVEEPS